MSIPKTSPIRQGRGTRGRRRDGGREDGRTGGREDGRTGGREDGTFLEPKKVPKKAAYDVKVNCWMKAGSGPGHLPRGGRWPGPLPVLFNRLSHHTQVLCFFPCTPRATALRQARVSGGNLQNCAPSAACGGAMTQERNVFLSSPIVPFVPSHGRAMPSAQAAST